jgi:hypothetical protein
VELVKNPRGETEARNAHKTYPATAVIRLAKRWHELPGNTTLAKLLERKPQQPATDAQKKNATMAPEIGSTDKLTEYSLSIANFVDNNERFNQIMGAVRKPDGGLLASAICKVYQGLKSVALHKDTVAKANAFEEEVEAAKADADAKADANKAA